MPPRPLSMVASNLEGGATPGCSVKSSVVLMPPAGGADAPDVGAVGAFGRVGVHRVLGAHELTGSSVRTVASPFAAQVTKSGRPSPVRSTRSPARYQLPWEARTRPFAASHIGAGAAPRAHRSPRFRAPVRTPRLEADVLRRARQGD